MEEQRIHHGGRGGRRKQTTEEHTKIMRESLKIL